MTDQDYLFLLAVAAPLFVLAVAWFMTRGVRK